MNIEISKQEAWRLLDALETYEKDYSVSVSATETIKKLKKKLKQIVNS
jgi:hypothetical protein